MTIQEVLQREHSGKEFLRDGTYRVVVAEDPDGNVSIYDPRSMEPLPCNNWMVGSTYEPVEPEVLR